MWALGVLLFAMLTGTFPFRGISEQDLYYKIQRGQFKIPDTVSKEARRLIYRMLEVDAKRRITARELIKESWVRCNDLPLTVFENAGTYAHRGSSLDNRISTDAAAGCHNQAISFLVSL